VDDMNERIKELHGKAFELTEWESLDWDKVMEKFAELIIKECADIAQQHNKSPVAAPLAIGYVIREHFGVEE
jgi:hypothetical protein